MTNYKDFISNILTEMADFRAYHGTPKVFGDFEYHATGKGNDALGAGFYFTDSTEVANAYTEETEGSNIRVATLTMDKPIVIEDHGEGEVVKSKPLTRLQIQKLVTSSPYFSQEIGNWDDVEFKGLWVVTRNVVNTYFEERDPMSQLIGIMREFYMKDLEAFSVNAKKYTGYDGIEKIFYNVGQNRDETWRHYVVWNKNQIKPMRPVNESYDFDYCCISPRSQKELDYIIDNMVEVSKEEFFKNVDVNDAIDGVASGVGVDYRQYKDPVGFIKRDWANRYYKIDKKGIDAYILVNSGVEHIFRNTERKPRASKSEPSKRIDKNVEYRGYKIGDLITIGNSKKRIEDIVIHPNNQTQFYVDGYWRLADDLIEIELKKEKGFIK